MTSAITLFEAIAVGIVLMLAFALYRRLMRRSNPPAFFNSDVTAFASALLLTIGFVGALAFEAFSVMPFVHSAFLSVIIALVLQISIWAVARSIIPLESESSNA